MPESKQIQIKDVDANLLFPNTLAAYVTNSTGATLEDVEAGAQVNLIEEVTYGGTALAIDSKSVALPVFTVAKLSQATEGYAATYQLTKDGSAVGDAINIPKDMVVESGTVEVCAQDDVPVAGYKVGDRYIDLVIANKASSHIYILVSDLVDVYTAGTGISIAGNTISVDVTDTNLVGAIEQSSTKLVNAGSVYAGLATKVDANADITAGTGTKLTVDAKGLVTAIADISADDVPNLAVTKINAMTSYTKAGSAAAIETSDTLSAAIGKLEYKADAAVVANAAISAATHTKVTYDEKGLITAGADLSASDIPDLDSSKITTFTNYVKGSSAAAVTTTDTLNQAISKIENVLDTKLTYTVIE